MTTATETNVLTIPTVTLDLQPGERYAGAVLDDQGHIKHHVILLPNLPEKRLAWSDAMAWAESVGGQLPTRQEQSLLFANCGPHLEPRWRWSCEEYESGSFAWTCGFSDGIQLLFRKSFEGSAVAVRRLIP